MFSKGNADTGVEGVAVVAGLAIIAAGAVVVSKKRSGAAASAASGYLAIY
mgnify:CR=1 FL=1